MKTKIDVLVERAQRIELQYGFDIWDIHVEAHDALDKAIKTENIEDVERALDLFNVLIETEEAAAQRVKAIAKSIKAPKTKKSKKSQIDTSNVIFVDFVNRRKVS